MQTTHPISVAPVQIQAPEETSVSLQPAPYNTTDRVLRVLLNPNDKLAQRPGLCLALLGILVLISGAF